MFAFLFGAILRGECLPTEFGSLENLYSEFLPFLRAPEAEGFVRLGIVSRPSLGQHK